MSTPLQAEIEQAGIELTEIRRQQRETLQSVNQIKADGENEQKKTDLIRKNREQAEKDFAIINENIAAAKNAHAAKSAEIESSKAKALDADAAYQAAEKKRASSVQEGARISSSLRADHEKIMAESKAKARDLVDQKRKLEDDISALADQESAIRDRISTLKSEESALSKSVDELKAKESEMILKHSELDQKAAAFAKEKYDHDSEIADKDARIADFDAQIAAKKTDIQAASDANDAMKEELKKNSLQNADYLKSRASVIEQARINEDRLTFLKQKYGDLGETW